MLKELFRFCVKGIQGCRPDLLSPGASAGGQGSDNRWKRGWGVSAFSVLPLGSGKGIVKEGASVYTTLGNLSWRSAPLGGLAEVPRPGTSPPAPGKPHFCDDCMFSSGL